MVGRPFRFPSKTRPTEEMEVIWIGSRWDRSPLVNPGMSGHPLVSRPVRIPLGSILVNTQPPSPAEKPVRLFRQVFQINILISSMIFPRKIPSGFSSFSPWVFSVVFGGDSSDWPPRLLCNVRRQEADRRMKTLDPTGIDPVSSTSPSSNITPPSSNTASSGSRWDRSRTGPPFLFLFL